MIVCICCNINEQTIVEMLHELEDPRELHPKCNQCINCGACLSQIKEMIDNKDEYQNRKLP